MIKSIVFILFGCLFSLNAFSQAETIEGILRQVEQNNQELKALAEYTESRQLELKSANNLPDPELGAYYLPFGEHNTGDYTEFEISQSFEFPTVYSARGRLINKKSEQLQLEYQAKRMEILSLAYNYCLNLVYLNKRLKTETFRVDQAQRVFDQVKELYEKEQIGILQLNKAKVAWMQEQFKIQQIRSDRKSLMLLLVSLNGGNEVSLNSEDYATPPDLAAKDSLWMEKQVKDPELVQLKQQEAIAQQTLKLAKNKTLPNLTAGYNTQGVAGERFSGIYAGISLPLWSSRNKVKAARSRVEFQELFTSSRLMQAFASFESQYNDYLLMLTRFQEYQNTLSGLNSDELLLKAYELGEISFMEYYMELQFYRQAYDAMLDMQYQLHLSQAELLKHQL